MSTPNGTRRPRWDQLRTEAHIRCKALEGATFAAHDAYRDAPDAAGFVRFIRTQHLLHRAWRRLLRRLTGHGERTAETSRAYAARALAHHHPEWAGVTDGRSTRCKEDTHDDHHHRPD